MSFYHTEGEKVYNHGEVIERTRNLWYDNNSVEQVIAMLREMSQGLLDPRVEVAVDEDPHGASDDQFIMVSGKPPAKNEHGETIREWTFESGKGRIDRHGIEWFACDPYPTWYRWKDGRLIVGNPRWKKAGEK